MLPTLFNENLFDDWMNDFDLFRGFGNETEHKLYGKHANRMMLTDVREHEDRYEVAVDLPGFKKEELNVELKNGYLTITAAKGLDEDEKDKNGKLIRQERYAGTLQRSFYVGENITEEEIKAKYESGVLTLTIPKKEAKKLPEKKLISIE